jgi:hypothetical protein
MALRLGGFNIYEVFGRHRGGSPIEQCQDPAVWLWTGLELLASRPRSPARGTTDCNTLLHVAARCNNTVAIQQLVRFLGFRKVLFFTHPHVLQTRIWMNPLLRDSKGKCAHELTSDAGVRETLIRYATQAKPRREVMRWYGPFVSHRVFEFLLVVQRWRRIGPVWLNRDVVNLIVGLMRNMESASFGVREDQSPSLSVDETA